MCTKRLNNNLLMVALHFIEPGVKVNGAYMYYCDNLLAKKLLPDIFRISQGGALSFNRTVDWRIEHVSPSLSWSERCPTSFLQHCCHRIHRIWIQSAIASGDCRRKSTTQNSLRQRTWNASDRRVGTLWPMIMDAAIGQWRRRLSACNMCPWSGAHFEHHA